jgi:hypothetical protein
LITTVKTEIAIYPYIEGNELILDISIGDNEDITPVRVPLAQLFDEYLEYNSVMFTKSIAPANKDDARQLIGILRLAAHTLETALV